MAFIIEGKWKIQNKTCSYWDGDGWTKKIHKAFPFKDKPTAVKYLLKEKSRVDHTWYMKENVRDKYWRNASVIPKPLH